MSSSVLEHSKVQAECQAVAKRFTEDILARGGKGKSPWYGDVRLHVTENNFIVPKRSFDHTIQMKHYENVIVHRTTIAQSKAFGVGKKTVCQLTIMLAYFPAGENYKGKIRVVAGKVDAYLPIKPKGFGENILPIHSPNGHPLLKSIQKVRQELSAFLEVKILREGDSY